MLKVLIDGVEYVPAETVAEEGYLSPHFREAEFDCNHCSQYGSIVSMELVELLENVRAEFSGNAVTINSGVRCQQHNTNVGGASSSRHLVGNADAADIVVSNTSPTAVANYLESIDPGRYGIGRYSSFTHIDVRGYSARWVG